MQSIDPHTCTEILCNLIDRPVTRWLGEREVKWFHEYYYSLLTFQYHLKSAQGVSRVWLLDRVFWSDLSLRPGCITGGGQARPREYPLTVQNVEQIFITRRDNPPAILDNYNNTSYHPTDCPSVVSVSLSVWRAVVRSWCQQGKETSLLCWCGLGEQSPATI